MINLLDSFAPTDLPPAAESLRPAVKEFLAHWMRNRPAELRARSWSGFDPEFSRALAQRGWIGLTLPVEYGGGGLDAFARFVLVEELLVAGAPVAAHWIADRQSGPLLMRYGPKSSGGGSCRGSAARTSSSASA
jgi:alkylation response protein AidB-like acyl-CoA dehydrogenase